MCGGRFTIACRSAAGVSPVRTAVRMRGIGAPPSALSSARVRASSAISRSGSSRLRWMSLLSALSGET